MDLVDSGGLVVGGGEGPLGQSAGAGYGWDVVEVGDSVIFRGGSVHNASIGARNGE